MPSSELPAGGRLAAFAPAGVGLAMFVGMSQIRMDDPWSDGALLAVAAAPAILLLAVGLVAARGDGAPRAAVTILLVAGLVLAGVAIGRLGQTLAGDDFSQGGGTLTWMLLGFTALAAFCARRSRSVACLLIAALVSVGLLLEAVNWVFDTENVDTFRALLALSFAVLFTAGLVVVGRAGTVLVGAAGVTVLVGAYATSFVLLFFPGGGGGLGWGWELVTLVEGLALLAYAAQRLEPGPGYLAFFVLAVFVTTAAVVGVGGQDGGFIEGSSAAHPRESPSLVGWPLALAIGTVAATLWGLRSVGRRA